MSIPTLFSGQGKIYLADRDSSGNPKGLQFLGNAPEFVVSPNTNLSTRIESNNDTNSYLDNSGDQSANYSVSFSLEDFTIENLQYILYGEASVVPAGSAVIQKTLYHGRNILGEINLSSCVVTGAANGVLIDLEAGVIDVATDSNIEPGSSYTVTYSWNDHTSLNMFSQRIKDKWLRFEGVNSVNMSKVIFDLPRVRLLPAELELISDDIYQAEFTGVGMRDAYAVTGNDFARVQV